MNARIIAETTHHTAAAATATQWTANHVPHISSLVCPNDCYLRTHVVIWYISSHDEIVAHVRLRVQHTRASNGGWFSLSLSRSLRGYYYFVFGNFNSPTDDNDAWIF